MKLYSCEFKGSARGVLPFQSAPMLGFLGGLWGLTWGWGASLLSFFVGIVGLWMLLGGWKICYIVMQTLPRWGCMLSWIDGVIQWCSSNFVQRPERCEQAGETWVAGEESWEAELDCAKGFPEVKKLYFFDNLVWLAGQLKDAPSEWCSTALCSTCNENLPHLDLQ